MNIFHKRSLWNAERTQSFFIHIVSQEMSSSTPTFNPVCKILPCLALAAISLCSPFAVGHAYAATWPVPTSELSAIVGFHETYSAGDKSYVHSGIDISASAGMQISSPQAGTVRYTGAVPSGDSRIGGSSPSKTMNAVSIEIEGGRVITLMPFSNINVSQGDYVGEGACLGTLAAEGDVSCTQSHLHMGLKKGSTYYDPMTLFGILPQTESQPEAAGEQIQAAPILHEQSIPVTEPAPSAEAHARELLENREAAEAGEVSTVSEEALGTIESAQVDLKLHAAEEPSFAMSIGTALEPLFSACCGQLSDLEQALRDISTAFRVPFPMFVAIFGLLSVLALAALCLIAVRFVSQGVSKIWRNSNSFLSARGGGDSMHELFPASGTAFITRSRMSPREVTK